MIETTRPMIQNIWNNGSVGRFIYKTKKRLKAYTIPAVLLFSLAALGLSGYNTYLIKTAKYTPTLPGTTPVAKMTTAEVNKMIKNGAPTLGNSNAKVTVVEFADFQCPYCGKYFKEVLPEIKQKYVDTGKVRFVFMNFAFLGEESKSAAIAARCAGDQGKFWEYHDHLYQNQQGENQGVFSVENLKEFANKLNLNTSQFNQCLDDKKYEKVIVQEADLGRTFGVKGTPATFVNDFFINGVQPLLNFINKIEEALKK